jgi:shikimate kinase
MNIVLAGFMGSGKTTVGRLLAKRLGWQFIDTDEEVERLTKTSIQELFLLRGEETFRAIERDIVWAASQLDHAVISIGGGALLHPDSVADLKKNGFLIWLKVCPHSILKRIPDTTSRPLLHAKHPACSIPGLIRQRRATYENCQLAIRTDRLTPQQVADQIMQEIQHVY